VTRWARLLKIRRKMAPSVMPAASSHARMAATGHAISPRGIATRSARLRALAWARAPDRGAMGIRRARWSRRRGRLVERVRCRGQADRQYLARRLPRLQHQRGRLRRDRAGRLLQAERLRPLRHDRQCLGVDERLVSAGSPARGGGQSEWTRIAEPRFNRWPVAKPGHQGRLFSVRFELLRTLSSGRAPAAGGRPRRRASWVSNGVESTGRRDTIAPCINAQIGLAPDLSGRCGKRTISKSLYEYAP